MQGKKNYKKVQLVLFILLLANFLVAFFKIIVGSTISSSSMTADGFHSISDGASNIIGILGISLASKPKDKQHPYGHDKIEFISGLLIGVFLLIIGGKVLFEAIGKISHPIAPHVNISGLIVLLSTFLVNIFVTVYEYKQGHSLNSSILISDASHTKSDLLVTAGVLITLVCIKLGLPPILDPIVSILVSLIIFHTAWNVFRENANILIDSSVFDEDKIRQIALSMEEVEDVHAIRSRGTRNQSYIDLHLVVNPHMTVSASHALSHALEKKLQKELPIQVQVLIHIEPHVK